MKFRRTLLSLLIPMVKRFNSGIVGIAPDGTSG